MGLVSIVGGESTGKSTLAHALGVRLPGLVVPETLRSWVATHQRTPDPEEQWHVFDAHVDAERAALGRAREDGVPWVVSDSGPLMTAVYSMQYHQSTDLVDAAIAHCANSALIVWCDDDFPWQPDPQRESQQARALTQTLLAGLVGQFPAMPVVRVSGSTQQRSERVCRELGCTG